MRLPFFRRKTEQTTQKRYLSNSVTGAGTDADKTANMVWGLPAPNEGALLAAYRGNWAARKAVDIIPDDATVRWRSFTGEERIAEAMREQEKEYDVRDRIASALKLGRLYGTALVIIATTEDSLATPLNIDAIRPGDLSSLNAFDCNVCSIYAVEPNIVSPDYGQPILYKITDGTAFLGRKEIVVHASRVLRFDGNPDVTGRGWGDSVLMPILQPAKDEESAANAASSLAQEASVSVIKLDNFREIQKGYSEGESADKMMNDISNRRSVYRTLFLDSQDEFQRIGAQGISGLPPVMDRLLRRLAAAAGIPATRFVGQSPVGLDATGDSDAQNYAATVQAFQETRIGPQLAKLDEVLLRNAGVVSDELPEYEWNSLLDISDSDLAATSKVKAEALKIGIDSGIIDEDEARQALDGDPVFGDLSEGEAPGMPAQPMPMLDPEAEE